MAPRSFKKTVVAVSGSFPGYKQADLKALVEKQGATFNAAVSPDCTHLVTTQRDVDKKSEKYAKKPLPVKKYLLDSDGAGGSGDGDEEDKKDVQDGGKKSNKRTIDAVDDSTDNDAKDESNKKAKDGPEKKLNVPVDEGYHGSGYEVYIDDAGEIWDATLNQTNAGANNNKFYKLQVLVDHKKGDYKALLRWGRVGEHGQSSVQGNGTLKDAQSEFQKKFRNKSGLAWTDRLQPAKPNKYAFIERNYEESDDEDEEPEKGDKKVKKEGEEGEEEEEEEEEVKSAIPEPIQELMSFIFNQSYILSTMASMSYDANKLPLGKLSKRTLNEGFRLLKELSELIDQPSNAQTVHNMTFAAAVEHLSNRYFTIIPHVFGRNNPPVLRNFQLLKKECELLEALTDMGITNEIMKGSKSREKIHESDRQFNGLGLQEMTVLERDGAEFTELEAYLNGSRGQTHSFNYKVKNIFRIERPDEEKRRSEAYGNVPNSCRRLLWHGSRSTNYGGILSQGLRIAPPEAPVNGYMFGKGVYFADVSSKSAGYCGSYSSGNMGLLLLCDVEVGDPVFEQDGANSQAATDSKNAGCLATLGRGRMIPDAWKDAGCVHPDLQGVKMPDVSQPHATPNSNIYGLFYNEYIVYDVKQIRQRYLFHVHMN